MKREKPDWVDARLDALMSVLVTLHECGVITDPAISTEQRADGSKAVTVEFLLDYPPAAAQSQGQCK